MKLIRVKNYLETMKFNFELISAENINKSKAKFDEKIKFSNVTSELFKEKLNFSST